MLRASQQSGLVLRVFESKTVVDKKKEARRTEREGNKVKRQK
jgi:hypothetical protein